ncbi:MAG: methyltransferase domain-containing protein [Chloroflexi bacterium]|nr:methyltransferase domain-containing protein [Chloroflexota bacterium]
MSNSERTSCPVCGNCELNTFFDLPGVPTHCNVLLPTREQALTVPRGNIRLAFCHTCGHIFNIAFDPELMAYTQQYENSLHFSPRFQEFADELAEGLTHRYTLQNKVIVDVGCGKGDFLRLMARNGSNRCYGFDPSYVPTPEDEQQQEITFVQDFYSEKYSEYQADLICCRHVLEHIQEPRAFLADIRRSMLAGDSSVVYFEVPNALFSLRDLSVWDIIYEHCGYFTPNSLIRLFADSGFEILRQEEAYGGQFISLEATLPQNHNGHAPSSDWTIRHLEQLTIDFSQRYREKLTYWTYMLEELEEQDQRVVLWGAGSKGVTFLNANPAKNSIAQVVDINPRKQGMFTAGTGHQIVSVESLQEHRPDVVLVMNRLYESEIRQMLRDSAPNAEILVV